MATLAYRAQSGDAEAFGELYDALVPAIYRYIYYRVGPVDAEDLTEIVFLRGWEKLDKYESHDSVPFSAWLFRIAHNLVIDHYRSQKNTATDELTAAMEVVDESADPTRRVESYFDQTRLKLALRQLPESYQQIIILKFINDFDNAEIAKIIGKSAGAVRVLQFRALAQLKEILEKEPNALSRSQPKVAAKMVKGRKS